MTNQDWEDEPVGSDVPEEEVLDLESDEDDDDVETE
jgi:hypothetical protein